MIKYSGIFFEGEQAELIKSLQPTKLDKTNDEIHCTFKYRPNNEELIDEIVGQEVNVYLIGYGCDGKNSGFKVEFDEIYNPYYKNYCVDRTNEKGLPALKTKHITVSLAEGATPSHTERLIFVKLAKPILVKGRFGYWIEDDDGYAYVSYKKSSNSK